MYVNVVDVSELGFELIHPVPPKRANELVHEGLRTQIDNLHTWASVTCPMTNGIDQVSLSQPDPTINKQRIIVFTRLVGYRHRSSMGKLIACADNEIIKRVLGNKIIISALGSLMLSVDLSLTSHWQIFALQVLVDRQADPYFVTSNGLQYLLDGFHKMIH